MRTITIRPTQPQADFHALSCKHPAFVGGFGTGKSETLANQALMDASHSSSALIGIYEPTYDLVRLIIAPRIQEKLTHHGIRYKYNKSENIVYTSSNQFGDFIFRTMDNPARIVGYETYTSHLDELDTLKKDNAADVWQKVMARNRQKLPEYGSETYNRVSAYCTPEGFNFMYDRWVMNKNDNYQMIQASTLSNPFLPDDYVETLTASYPDELISAYINGEFTNLTSGTIYRSYDRDKHDSTETIQPREPLYIGQDFNVDNMASTIYVKRGQVWHAVDEMTGGYDTNSTAETIKARYPDHKIYVYPDASGDNRKTSSANQTDIDILRQAGFYIRAHKKNPSVKDRINSVNRAFEKGLLFINYQKCPETARCLEQQVYDKNGAPDKSSGDDHQNDATGYPIAYELPIKRPFAGVSTMTGF